MQFTARNYTILFSPSQPMWVVVSHILACHGLRLKTGRCSQDSCLQSAKCGTDWCGYSVCCTDVIVRVSSDTKIAWFWVRPIWNLPQVCSSWNDRLGWGGQKVQGEEKMRGWGIVSQYTGGVECQAWQVSVVPHCRLTFTGKTRLNRSRVVTISKTHAIQYEYQTRQVGLQASRV